MTQYQAPLEDMQFLLSLVFKAPEFWAQAAQLKGQLEPETATALLKEAAKFAEHSLQPLNRSGDEEGAQWAEGKVTTPKGFVAAYEQFSSNGFAAMAGGPEYGGLGMPKTLGVLVDEMMYAANSAFYLYPALSAGACLALEAHGSEEIKQRFLPKLYAGEWSGSMCLTEPQAGSDLGLIRTKAEPNGDGTYQITGTKIFITGGDHDLTSNVVHLVLAKLPGAPSGSKGISLFLVPKFWVNEAGDCEQQNGVSCGSLEHKMGIKASATCVMNFDAARGYLIGEVNRGLNCMFTMMNCERLSIGIQGIGSAEMSYQNAAAYAKERVQGGGSILGHADVRRMLLTMKANTEASRAFAVYMAGMLDQVKHGTDEVERVRSSALVALLTPVAKAFFTDLGLESTVLGQQVFGGHGYIREWGQEQLVRDVRIAQIYEGTNGIQAQDLVQRKVFADRGEWLGCYLEEIKSFCDECAGELKDLALCLAMHLDKFQALTNELIEKAESNRHELGAAACDYLHVLGYLSYGYMWLRMMAAVQQPGTSNEFKNRKLKTGRFYFARILPRIESLQATIAAGGNTLMEMQESEF